MQPPHEKSFTLLQANGNSDKAFAERFGFISRYSTPIHNPFVYCDNPDSCSCSSGGALNVLIPGDHDVVDNSGDHRNASASPPSVGKFLQDVEMQDAGAALYFDVLREFLPCMSLAVEEGEKSRDAFLACSKQKIDDHVTGKKPDPKLAEGTKRDHPEFTFDYLRDHACRVAAVVEGNGKEWQGEKK